MTDRDIRIQIDYSRRKIKAVRNILRELESELDRLETALVMREKDAENYEMWDDDSDLPPF